MSCGPATKNLARFNRAAVDRELRMIELKKEINALCANSASHQPVPAGVREGVGHELAADLAGGSRGELWRQNAFLAAFRHQSFARVGVALRRQSWRWRRDSGCGWR